MKNNDRLDDELKCTILGEHAHDIVDCWSRSVRLHHEVQKLVDRVFMDVLKNNEQVELHDSLLKEHIETAITSGCDPSDQLNQIKLEDIRRITNRLPPTYYNILEVITRYSFKIKLCALDDDLNVWFNHVNLQNALMNKVERSNLEKTLMFIHRFEYTRTVFDKVISDVWVHDKWIICIFLCLYRKGIDNDIARNIIMQTVARNEGYPQKIIFYE